MDARANIISTLQRLTKHSFIEITMTGDAAIEAALRLLPKGSQLLIPEEGGWLSYEKLPKKLGLTAVKVICDDARLNLPDLKQKLSGGVALLYQNPGGYFAEQPMKEIYEVCHAAGCLVIMDVSGALGTKLCVGNYADIMVGSFGEWKLVEAKWGGFISCQSKELFGKLQITPFTDNLEKIQQALERLPQRIAFLRNKVRQIRSDLDGFNLIHPHDEAFVVVVRYENEDEKVKVVQYCKGQNLPFTECPRYIRLMDKAICIEVKKLEEKSL